MKMMTGGQAAVEALQTESVAHVFGLIGSATMEMFDALYDAKDITFVGVRDERTGTHMADGYARASGRAGVILAGQNGPGATNLVTGLAQAAAAFSPVVSIAGAISSAHLYRDAFQEVDQQSLFKPVTKKTWTATSADRVPEMFREAFRVALTPRRGPVQLNLPRDVLAAQAEFPAFQPPNPYRSQTVPAGAQLAIEQAAALLAGATRPVIIAGGGIKNSEGHAQALALAEALNCPIVTSPGHGDAIPFGHPLNAGQMGPRGNVVASRLVREADVILAFDLVTSLDERQRKTAVIAAEAPAEIRAAGAAQPPAEPPAGIPFARLSADQQSVVRRLVETYCGSMPAEVAGERLAVIEKGSPAAGGLVHHGWDEIHFAWAGALEPGKGHYYRLEGPSFVVEFVNVQPDAEGNPANHIHCVWRDKTGDFR